MLAARLGFIRLIAPPRARLPLSMRAILPHAMCQTPKSIAPRIVACIILCVYMVLNGSSALFVRAGVEVLVPFQIADFRLQIGPKTFLRDEASLETRTG